MRSIARPAAALVLIAASLFPLAASAGEIKTSAKAVIELFTSQGCSSCPPADQLLTELSGTPEVIALSYHVDYWDYAGWPDTLGHEANTQLQRNYAASWHNNRIYTPQMVVNGLKGVVGSRRNEVSKAIGTAELALPVELLTSNDMLEITVPGQAGLSDAVVWLVSYIDAVDVAIERGENSGKTITYSHVVTGRRAVGMWEAGMGMHIKLPLSEVLDGPADGAVVLVQAGTKALPGPILGAAAFEN